MKKEIAVEEPITDDLDHKMNTIGARKVSNENRVRAIMGNESGRIYCTEPNTVEIERTRN